MSYKWHLDNIVFVCYETVGKRPMNNTYIVEKKILV